MVATVVVACVVVMAAAVVAMVVVVTDESASWVIVSLAEWSYFNADSKMMEPNSAILPVSAVDPEPILTDRPITNPSFDATSNFFEPLLAAAVNVVETLDPVAVDVTPEVVALG